MRTIVDGPVVRFEMTRTEVLDLWEAMAPGYKMQAQAKAAAESFKKQVGSGQFSHVDHDDLGYGPVGAMAGHHYHPPMWDDAVSALADAVRTAVREMAGAIVKVAA